MAYVRDTAVAVFREHTCPCSFRGAADDVEELRYCRKRITILPLPVCTYTKPTVHQPTSNQIAPYSLYARTSARSGSTP